MIEIKARLMRSSTLAPDSNGGCHVVERIYARGSLGHSGLRCHDVFHDPRRPIEIDPADQVRHRAPPCRNSGSPAARGSDRCSKARVSAAISHSGCLYFPLGNAWMYSPASRKVRSIKPSGVVIGTWKARDQDITRPSSPIQHAARNRSGHRSLALILIWGRPIGILR